jgi:alpha-glucosidase
MINNKKDAWWKHGVIYHIYPLSFNDSNNDGKGDIPGIITKLDYLSELGVDAIWLSPVYSSPMMDFGYDVSDYYTIDPVFGTMDDFKKLLDEAHARGIRVIMDMIMNHTSHLHPWFLESKSSKYNNPKHDWYIWHNPRKGRKPNRWKSALGGSAWEYDKTTKQYYLHTFLKEQPDLNWRNKYMRKAFFDIIEFWLNMGVDGFRFDAINMIVKHAKLRNNPALFGIFRIKEKWSTRNQPYSYTVIRKMRKLFDKYEDAVSIGEIYAFPPGNPAVSASYLGCGNDMLDLTFDFSIVFRWWNARRYYNCIRNWYEHIPDNGWPSIVFSNHDLCRSYNRFGIGFHKKEKAKVAAVLLLTLKGTPFIYYGEEIGMKNTWIAKSQLQDPIGKPFWPFYQGRDMARTPMQWNAQQHAGFSNTQPWLPVNSSYVENNVEQQKEDKDSLYNIYKTLLSLRKEHKPLQAGEWEPMLCGKRGIIAYAREYDNEKIIVLLNFTASSKKARIHHTSEWQVLFSTHRQNAENVLLENMKLFPFEATVLNNETDQQ